MKRLVLLGALLLAAGGCNCSGTALTGTGDRDSGHPDGGGGGADGGPTDAGHPPNCTPTSKDLTGCGCTLGQQRSCYPDTAAASTENVGACHDGVQTCVSNGELASFGPCMDAGTPTTEICNDGIDNDCNGKIDCQDPNCFNSPFCNTGCDAGQTRPCYDGPAGTDNVGTCHDGVQTCDSTGQWTGPCNGEVLPAQENCCDLLDHNCNGLPGCFDFFSCLASPCCNTQCDAGPGCACPQGQGDSATCPEGDVGVSGGGFPGWVACCPCTVDDCSNAGCCGETVCQGNAACAGLTCNALPASCNGQVNQDCDDFPEDCDEPCCKCTACNCARAGQPCAQDSDCCSQSCNGTSCD